MSKPTERFHHYHYTLTDEEHSAIQVFLRMMPAEWKKHLAWQLLHDLTYGDYGNKPSSNSTKSTREPEENAQ